MNSRTSWNFFEWLPLLGSLLYSYISNSNRSTLGRRRRGVCLHVFTITTMNPFNIMIPTLPPLDLLPTPRKDPRKRGTLEDRHSPAKRFQENIQRDPPSLVEYLTRFPLSPSRTNKKPLHPISLPAPFQFWGPFVSSQDPFQ